MAEIIALSKILDIRENEKKIAQRAYNQSLDSFEKVATELYHILQKKERAEDSYDQFLHALTPIERIKEQSAYIEQLNRQINDLQFRVQKARSEMESKQHQLSDAHVEVKKFEKIIEIRKETKANIQKKMENAFMDEISITQFLSHKNR
ncbi:flagellar export protein FliJ [Oceanobacillus polygoni]|uniref:Flagellar FliJ protein n=1 Tax=Oceanobacillus polygoni TaxID=1235259 RepID=A0A9X0YS25_9BACI|nr:flagellar export protein FliJ [Oceanobacillus polygoni]MBP2077658.1 flagellar FliJ protein [Oceanobacillus polygoni]